jgi:hypothetical protein
MARVLSIQDLHAPFHHPDAVPFLQSVRDKYRTDTTVCVGDESEQNKLSVHDDNPDLPSAGDELRLTREGLRPVFHAFPKVKICHSNHGNRWMRQGLRAGIPKGYLRGYREVLDAPAGWTWAEDWTIDGVLYTHGEHASNEAKALDAAFRWDINVVQGHIHTKACIVRGKSRSRTRWAVMGGCMIDFAAPCFDYARKGIMRPMLGAPVIIDGDPIYVEMKLKANGRWAGKL